MLEFYPMPHGDPKSGDWVLLRYDDRSEIRGRWDKNHNCFVGDKGVSLFVEGIVGWLPIGYWRPAETCPENEHWLISVVGGDYVLRGVPGDRSILQGWQPMPIAPPMKPLPPVNPLAVATDADLIAELKRRMVTK